MAEAPEAPGVAAALLILAEQGRWRLAAQLLEWLAARTWAAGGRNHAFWIVLGWFWRVSGL